MLAPPVALIPTIGTVLPAVFLGGSSLVLLFVGLFLSPKNSARFSFGWAQLSCIIAIFCLLLLPTGKHISFSGMFINNPFTIIIKLFLFSITFFILSLNPISQSNNTVNNVEYPVLMLLSLVGMCVMISAYDLLVLFMGLELQSLCLYVLVGMKRNKKNKSSEAALKYFILGALSSGLFLYGCSLVYGFTGTASFEELNRFFKEVTVFNQDFIGSFAGLIFILAGLAFKLSVVPFHMWAPDVYQGSSTSVTAFLATVPKLAAFFVLARLLLGPFSGFGELWGGVIAAMAMLSMALGSIAALTQQNIKRLVAYSSIGHMGFALIGLSVADNRGLVSSFVYLFLYILATLGFFGGILYLEKLGKEVDCLSDLNGVGRKHPIIACFLGFMLLSMAGLPPLPGFVPKLLILLSAIDNYCYSMVFVGVIYSVISAAYYLLILKALFIDKPPHSAPQSNELKRASLQSVLVLIAIFVLLLGFLIFPSYLLNHFSQIIIFLMFL
ncbi:MAG: NADH-quinone oxidoreductase subunit N [Alphaproteobacteria bacterium]|nr:NADH-quinone oxidoreductase subunit N [Alphaproteobacteria bacterium]